MSWTEDYYYNGEWSEDYYYSGEWLDNESIDTTKSKPTSKIDVFKKIQERSNRYVADFETVNDEDDSRVWLYSIVEIETLRVVDRGTSLDEFMLWCANNEKNTVYIHNLKFDGEFIIAWLLKNGFNYTDYELPYSKKTFKTLISGLGEFYMIEMCFGKRKRKLIRTTIYDSLKILPMKVADIPEAFGLEESKLEIDYNKPRPIGYKPEQDEIDYVDSDCIIVAKALKKVFELGLTRLTLASNALSDYKETIGLDRYDYLFPILPIEMDDELRNAYRGGLCYLNPRFKGKVTGRGLKLDINGAYYHAMATEYLPYGRPIEYEGSYEYDENYRRYIQVIECSFTIKPNEVPFVHIRNNFMFSEEAVESTNYEVVQLTLTDIELQLFLQTYEVFEIYFIKGWKFKSSCRLFEGYINKWYNIRKLSKENGDIGTTTIAKRMLTALYGAFGKRPIRQLRKPCLQDGMVYYRTSMDYQTTTEYVPVAIFTTSYVRVRLLRAIRALKQRFIYCDTDSLDLIGWDLPEELPIHQSELGAWKLEHRFNRSKFLGQKQYVQEKEDGTLKTVVAGMGERAKKHITFDNFNKGQIYENNLKKKRTKDGAILYDDIFELK